ncbi:hypothetical protein HK102_009050, partial [Quaeritorhiza haematococci]
GEPNMGSEGVGGEDGGAWRMDETGTRDAAPLEGENTDYPIAKAAEREDGTTVTGSADDEMNFGTDIIGDYIGRSYSPVLPPPSPTREKLFPQTRQPEDSSSSQQVQQQQRSHESIPLIRLEGNSIDNDMSSSSTASISDLSPASGRSGRQGHEAKVLSLIDDSDGTVAAAVAAAEMLMIQAQAQV